jgi:hypothetical protein
MDFGNESVGIGGDDRKGTNPFTRRRLLPIPPNARNPKRRAVFHGDGVGLLRLLPFDRFPLEESVHRHDASTSAVGLAERRQIAHRLALGVDRLAAAFGIAAPVRDQSPAQRIKRHHTRLVVAAYDQEFLGSELRSTEADNCARGCRAHSCHRRWHTEAVPRFE